MKFLICLGYVVIVRLIHLNRCLSSRLPVVFSKHWRIIWHMSKERRFPPNRSSRGNEHCKDPSDPWSSLRCLDARQTKMWKTSRAISLFMTMKSRRRFWKKKQKLWHSSARFVSWEGLPAETKDWTTTSSKRKRHLHLHQLRQWPLLKVPISFLLNRIRLLMISSHSIHHRPHWRPTIFRMYSIHLHQNVSPFIDHLARQTEEILMNFQQISSMIFFNRRSCQQTKRPVQFH